MGLAGARAKDAIFTDLDGDGYWDLCLDRQRLYRSRKGARFEALETHGIEFPTVRYVPLTGEGTPDEAKAKERPLVPHYLYFADVDNDGDQDALWGVHSHWEHPAGGAWKTVEAADHGLRSRVYLNDGKAHFRRAPDSGYTADDAFGPAMALAIVDVDRDGCLDLFEGREYRVYGVAPQLRRRPPVAGRREGRLRGRHRRRRASSPSPEPARADSSRPTYGVTHADVNGDGSPDLLALSYGRQWNRLWMGRKDGTFRDVGMETGFAGDAITHGRYPDWVGRPPEPPFRANGNTFDCAVGDLDGDLDLDFFLGEIQHAWAGEASDPPSLLDNRGRDEDWSLRRVPCQEGLPPRDFREPNPRGRNWADLHVAFLDFDNDTRLDLLVGSGDYPDGQFLRLYRQRQDGTFEDATADAGFDWEGCGDLSIGDFDRDGDVDMSAGRSFMRLNQAHRDRFMGGMKVNEVGLFENRHRQPHGEPLAERPPRGQGARPRQPLRNRGSRATLRPAALRSYARSDPGPGLSNHQDPPEACFGLGTAKRVEKIEVRWPGRRRIRGRVRGPPRGPLRHGDPGAEQAHAPEAIGRADRAPDYDSESESETGPELVASPPSSPSAARRGRVRFLASTRTAMRASASRTSSVRPMRAPGTVRMSPRSGIRSEPILEQPGHRVRLVVRILELHVGLQEPRHVEDAGEAVDEGGRLRDPLHEPGRHVGLVDRLPDELLHQVVHRDDAERRPVFVDDDHHPPVLGLQVPEHVVHGARHRNEVRRSHDLRDGARALAAGERGERVPEPEGARPPCRDRPRRRGTARNGRRAAASRLSSRVRSHGESLDRGRAAS